jgi:hypothetical protein
MPEFEHKGGKAYNDYGLGYYMTRDKDLAGEWATLATGTDGYINEYSLDTDGFNMLYLDKEDIKHWIAVLMRYRKGNYEDELYDVIDAFCAKYLIGVNAYDVILGWRADDSYFAFVEDFALGLLSLENLQKAMKFGDLGQQVCLKSKLSFDRIKFVTHYPAPADKFYQLAKDRDNAARAAYRKLRKETNARAGTLITDLI